MYSLEECKRIWDEVGQHGGPAERIRRAEAWLPYCAYIAGPMLRMPFTLDHTADGFPSYLIREKLVRAEDSVLDIGAGMGGDTLHFAAHCRSVAALALSGACLDVLRQRAVSC